MSSNKVYGETTWGIILAEALDSSGGTAGDGLTVNFTNTTPANDYLFLFGNKVQYKIGDKDKTRHLPGNKSLTNKIGKGDQFVNGQGIIIPSAKISDLNKITKTFLTWRKSGASPVYIALWKPETGTANYVTFIDGSGNFQNWLVGYLKSINIDISNFPIKINFNFEESWV